MGTLPIMGKAVIIQHTVHCVLFTGNQWNTNNLYAVVGLPCICPIFIARIYIAFGIVWKSRKYSNIMPMQRERFTNFRNVKRLWPIMLADHEYSHQAPLPADAVSLVGDFREVGFISVSSSASA